MIALIKCIILDAHLLAKLVKALDLTCLFVSCDTCLGEGQRWLFLCKLEVAIAPVQLASLASHECYIAQLANMQVFVNVFAVATDGLTLAVLEQIELLNVLSRRALLLRCLLLHDRFIQPSLFSLLASLPYVAHFSSNMYTMTLMLFIKQNSNKLTSINIDDIS